MADSGRWRTLQAIITKQFPNVRVTSSYRPGSMGTSGADYHSSGNAIDIAPPSMAVFNWLAATYPQSEEIIYTPAGDRQIKNGKPHKYSASVAVGHYNHIHWAWLGSGTANPNATSANFVTDAAGSAIGSLTGLSDFAAFITNPGMWARLGIAVAALVLLLAGFVRITGVSGTLGKVLG